MRKIVWLTVSFLMVLSLVLASCAPQVTEEKEVVTPPTEKKEVVTTPTEKKEVVPTGPEMVKLSLKKLDGTVVEKIAEKPRYGGTITTVCSADPASFDPIDQNSLTNTNYAAFVYQKLQIGDYTRSPNGTNEYAFTHFFYIPEEMRTGCVAESWEQPDPLTVIWHIRKGIRFQNIPPVNGRELTAGDVVYSMLRQKSSLKATAKYYAMVESVTATDKYTVVEKLKWPDLTHIEIAGAGSVTVVTYAREMVEKYGNLNDWHNACGTGPWMVEDYIRGSVLTLKKNPDYWTKDHFFPENTLPYADGVKMLIIPDYSTQMSALRTGKIDVIIENLSWADAESLKKTNPEINQRPYINSAGSINICFRVDKPPCNNILVRQALTLAIDQNAILNDVLRGHGELNNYPLMRAWGESLWTPLEKLPTEPRVPGSKCSVRELFTYNPEKAKQLLAEAGYPNGFKTDVILMAREVDVTSMVAAYWKDIGVDLELHVKDEAVKTAMISAIPKTYPEGMAVQNVNAVGPTDTWSSAFVTGAARNAPNISNPHIDQTYLDIVAEPDQAKRYKLSKDLGIYVLEQAYYIVGPNPEVYNFWQPWIKNCEGASRLSSWGMANAFAYYWVDQDLKEEMTGRR